MLKIFILFLVALIVYFLFKIRKGMTTVDNIYNKENIENMKQIQIDIQRRLDENKTGNKK